MAKFSTYWESPSNIALVKYWGKKAGGVQYPANASISFTLTHCVSRTKVDYDSDATSGISVTLDGEESLSFLPKINQFFKRIEMHFPFVVKGSWIIDTSNTFPHSSGIASSASGMSALALCICTIAKEMGLLEQEELYRKASEMARLGSGSAARSVFGPLAIWGQHPDINGSNDDYAIPFEACNDIFKDFCDTILLVHKGSKEVSSSVGHDLINEHPFAYQRFEAAQNNMVSLLAVLQSGDLNKFISIVESEALMLHALMMSSNPYFILMKPNTLAIIEKIWQKRRENGKAWLFTLDAGANVHFLFPKADEQMAMNFVENELVQYCQDGAYICDQVGVGPKEYLND